MYATTYVLDCTGADSCAALLEDMIGLLHKLEYAIALPNHTCVLTALPIMLALCTSLVAQISTASGSTAA